MLTTMSQPPSQTDMRIRPAQFNELGQLSALAMRSKAHWGYSAAQMDCWREDLSLRPEQIAPQVCRVAVMERRLAGFFVLAVDQQWSLDHLWVDPIWIGHGVGKALLRQACGLAAEQGANALAIDSDPYAEAFYCSQGAQRVSTLPAPIAGDPARVRPQLRLSIG